MIEHFLQNTPAQAKSLWHSLEQAASGIYFNQDGAISSLKGKPLKLVDQSIYLSSNISSMENYVNTHIGKAWTATDMLSTIWISSKL